VGLRRAIALCIVLSAWVVPASAEAGRIAAAGRIEHENGNTCSAALIAPDVVLTAAHCARPGDTLVFRPGDGQSGEVYAASRVFVHPLYVVAHWRTDWRLRFDLAVAKLETPVPLDRAVPLPVGDEAEVGEILFVVSWRGGDGDRPRQKACPVLATVIPGLVTLGCRVQGGESGAPVIRRTEGGLELVAVISSRNQVLNQPVAHASNIRFRLQPLFDAIEQAP
jgi:V8-like Glu-specific endopeptidase